MRSTRSHAARCRRRTALEYLLAAAVFLGSGPVGAHAAVSRAGDPAPPDARFCLGGRDAMVVGAGGALTLAGLLIAPTVKPVPAEGLAPEDIRWGLDRRALGNPHRGALVAGSLFHAGAGLYPLLATAATRGTVGFLAAQSLTLRDQTEAVLLATGLTLILKDATSRPRPFTYAPDDALPDARFYDTRDEAAFASFPSGHAATAWASAMTAVGALATRRPDLSPRAHFLNGALAGGLATAASLLRVDAQAHFPTDVAAGTAIGAGVGVAVTLLHAGPPPAGARRGRAWGYELAGVGAGVLLGFLLAPPTSPWIE